MGLRNALRVLQEEDDDDVQVTAVAPVKKDELLKKMLERAQLKAVGLIAILIFTIPMIQDPRQIANVWIFGISAVMVLFLAYTFFAYKHAPVLPHLFTSLLLALPYMLEKHWLPIPVSPTGLLILEAICTAMLGGKLLASSVTDFLSANRKFFRHKKRLKRMQQRKAPEAA